MKHIASILTLLLAAACGNPPEPTQSNTQDDITKTDIKAGLCVLVYPLSETSTEFRAGFAADSVEPMTGCMYFVASQDVTLYSEDAEVIATESCVSVWELASHTNTPCVLNTVPQ